MTDLPAKPFAIGLTPLNNRPWLIVDDRLPAYLAEKTALRAKHRDRVFVAEPETAAAQKEALDRVLDWQLIHSPEYFCKKGDEIHIAGVCESVCINHTAPPLETAGKLCVEDLVLMRKGETGWRLVAASLSFPSSWTLADKFSLPINQIHEPVPGFADGTRNATLVNRIFDNLAPDEPVLRRNWSIYSDDKLHHPHTHHGEGTNTEDLVSADMMFLREERQTLTRLPTSGDLLFTILITISPMSELTKSQSSRVKAADLLAHLENMSHDELAYKALTPQKSALTELLRQIVRGLI